MAGIEHSENKIIRQSGMFGNRKIGPGLLQSNVRQTRARARTPRHTLRATDYMSILSVLDEIFADRTLLNTKPEQ